MTSKSYSIKRSILAGALLLSQSIALSPLAAMAADNDVHVAGQAIFSVPAAGGLTADKRAAAVQQNLDNALVAAKDRGPSSVNITYVKGVPVITLGGYQVVTVDSASAKSTGSSPALLAKKWADSLRESLRDQASIQSYVGQLSGDYFASAPSTINAPAPQQQPAYNPNQQPQQGYGQSQNTYQAQTPYQQPAPYQQQAPYGQPQGGYRQGRITYAPAGLVIPISLSSGIATQVAKAGDLIQASVSQTVMLGDSTIPAGSTIIGTITEAKGGTYLGRAGSLDIKFNRLRTPDGTETPISAHLIGGIGKYTGTSTDDTTIKGETWKTKLGQAAIRGGIGAGTGAALGTAVGAIAGGGRGVGKGAWSGTAIGGTVGVAQSVLLRKGKDVLIPAGTAMQLQLDAPVTVA
ncbi:MAG: hypothetical protein C0508_22175, partial [Cyanobacteria bacterium PR.023]|nr:hypothetical protein [Cyanobacteria bacterium PR.023]